MDRKLRILCPTYWYPAHARDTQATYVHDINRHLAGRGHSVRVVTPLGEGGSIRDEFDGVEVIRFPLELPEDLSYGRVAQSHVSALQKVQRLVAVGRYLTAQRSHAVAAAHEFGADVVHAHWAIPTGPAALLVAQRLRIPSVITMHGGDVYVNPEQGYDFPTRWYVRPVLRWTLNKASALTAITDDCKQHAIRAGAPSERVEIISNGADLRRFSPATNGHGAGVREAFGGQMVFACRQLFPRKGIRFLVEAAARLKPRFPQLKLVLAGDGFERPELEELAARLGIGADTTFLGWVANADLPAYYRAAAVAVIPSLEEGFGIPAAEAMGCEIPVVASDAGGLPEVVADGVTGKVVPRGDVGALTTAIGELLSDEALRSRMGKAGRERALRLFDWERAAEQFERLYLRLLEENGSRR